MGGKSGDFHFYRVADNVAVASCSAGVGMGIVLPSLRNCGADSRLHPHKVLARGLVTRFFEPVDGGLLHIDEHSPGLAGHLTAGLGVVAKGGLVEHPVLEMPSGYAGEKHRRHTHRAGGGDEHPQIVLIGTPSGGIDFLLVLFLVVVAELYEQIVSAFHIALHLVPEPLIDEALRTAAVSGVVFHLNRGVEKVFEHHSPAPFGIKAGNVFVGHSGIAHKMKGNHLFIGAFCSSGPNTHE